MHWDMIIDEDEQSCDCTQCFISRMKQFALNDTMRRIDAKMMALVEDQVRMTLDRVDGKPEEG